MGSQRFPSWISQKMCRCASCHFSINRSSPPLHPPPKASFPCAAMTKGSGSPCATVGGASSARIAKWGNGKISYKQLYKTLHEYESLIGFWRRSGTTVGSLKSPLVFFEWGPFYIMGSRSRTGTYEVIKTPFLWVSITSKGESINYLDPEGKLELSESLVGPCP